MGWLDLLILFFCCVIEVFLLYDYFNNFFESKLKRKYIKILCAGTIGAIFLVNMLQSSILNLILIPMILWIFVTVLFDSKLGIRFAYFIMAYSVMIGVEFLYVILSNTTTALLAKTGLIPVSEYLWQLLLVKFLNYIVFIVLKQMSAKSKTNDKQTVSYLSMRTRVYFRYYAYRVLFRNRYRKQYGFKDINDIVFCMHDNRKHGIILRISKVYGKFK